MDTRQRQQIKSIFEDFLRRRLNRVERLDLDDLNINPFLYRLLSHELEFQDARSIVKWRMEQFFERGTVTSFGGVLEDIARVFSEGTGVEGADIMKTKGEMRYYIQVKSGPNTVPKDMATQISTLLQSAQRRNRGSVALFGMCYGNEEQVSSIVHRYVQVDYLIGREFWEFISDEPDCIDQIYEIAAEVSRTFRDAEGRTLTQALDDKADELADEFGQLYSASGPEMWQSLLDRNS
ncbi:hypothetical protein E3J38_02025 [candidate division TA06 bacterium]|uniref:Type II restriction endonuclease EcoO109IR domain-containing protein n=1 Tax=candidate division TA06 bacterium TaxID=2250710 RepID=A0A523XTE6_UNCT6|nr:MAG: hypothetical protein E3J38_02025 [candidate division TA06 bacterium]